MSIRTKNKRAIPEGKPVNIDEWKFLMPKGLWYTAKQISLRAMPPIKEVTARRWLQHGSGKGILEMKKSGIVKRYRVK